MLNDADTTWLDTTSSIRALQWQAHTDRIELSTKSYYEHKKCTFHISLIDRSKKRKITRPSSHWKVMHLFIVFNVTSTQLARFVSRRESGSGEWRRILFKYLYVKIIAYRHFLLFFGSCFSSYSGSCIPMALTHAPIAICWVCSLQEV